jgi:hypothetical protein
MTSPQYDPAPPSTRTRRSSASTWTAVIVVGIAALIGIFFFGTYAKDHMQTADHPAVMTAPAPAAGKPAPAPETTTGQRVEPARKGQ